VFAPEFASLDVYETVTITDGTYKRVAEIVQDIHTYTKRAWFINTCSLCPPPPSQTPSQTPTITPTITPVPTQTPSQTPNTTPTVTPTVIEKGIVTFTGEQIYTFDGIPIYPFGLQITQNIVTFTSEQIITFDIINIVKI
jgi:hypothetical protein